MACPKRESICNFYVTYKKFNLTSVSAAIRFSSRSLSPVALVVGLHCHSCAQLASSRRDNAKGRSEEGLSSRERPPAASLIIVHQHKFRRNSVVAVLREPQCYHLILTWLTIMPSQENTRRFFSEIFIGGICLHVSHGAHKVIACAGVFLSIFRTALLLLAARRIAFKVGAYLLQQLRNSSATFDPTRRERRRQLIAEPFQSIELLLLTSDIDK